MLVCLTAFVARSAFINPRHLRHFQPSRSSRSSFASCSTARPRLNTRRFWAIGSILLSRHVCAFFCPAYTPPWLICIGAPYSPSSVQAVNPVHAFKLIGMLLDAHMNLMTIDIVRLLYSPKMVRLPSPSSRLAAAYLQCMQLTQLCTHFCRSYWTISRRCRRYCWLQASPKATLILATLIRL